MKTKKIKIKDLQPGMMIKSYDSVSQETVFRPVEDVWETIVPVSDQRHIVFANGAELHCSKNHPIMTLGENGVTEKLPDDLTVEDLIISDTSPTHILSVTGDNKSENYIDITVSDTELFYAQDSLDTDMVLTHNCSQGGVRGGSATVHFPFWHTEIESLIVLKNNKGVEENRVRHMDYSIQFCELFYKRLVADENITLFSPHQVPDLQEAFYAGDNKRFEELYVKYEKSRKIMKKSISAYEFLESYTDERGGTGRIYLQNIDHSNTHSSFDSSKHPISMSNLCMSGDSNIWINIDDEYETEVALHNVYSIISMAKKENKIVKVKSKNLETNDIEWKEIDGFQQTHDNAEVMRITDEETGASIVCTPDHKVYTKNRGFVEAKDLKEDDILDISK
jgi:hypothetical protein